MRYHVFPSKPNNLYSNFFYSILNKIVISSDQDKWDILYDLIL
jgi:hypothetical protein